MRVNVLYDNRIGEAPIDADDGLEVYKSGLRKRAWRWQGTTANATPAALTAQNTIALAANTAYAFEGLVVARYASASTAGAYKISGCVKMGAAAANTAIVGTVTVTAYEDTAGMDVGVTANTTDGCLTITVTGVSATSINWICELEFIKVGASL